MIRKLPKIDFPEPHFFLFWQLHLVSFVNTQRKSCFDCSDEALLYLSYMRLTTSSYKHLVINLFVVIDMTTLLIKDAVVLVVQFFMHLLLLSFVFFYFKTWKHTFGMHCACFMLLLCALLHTFLRIELLMSSLLWNANIIIVVDDVVNDIRIKLSKILWVVKM